MKKNVLLSIRGRQNYQGQDPDVIEMVTEGTLELRPDGWEISYEESELTGLLCFSERGHYPDPQRGLEFADGLSGGGQP